MKAHTLSRITAFVTALAFVFVFSCEGPMGPAGLDGVDGADGIDGVNGVDGNVTCLGCHSDGNIQSKNEEFWESQHSSGDIAVSYAGGRSYCAECHSHEGFLEWVNTGTVTGNISAPSAWECSTCHGIHQTFEETDFALRITDEISFKFDNSVSADFGNGNICAKCHQSRRAEPNTTNPGEATFTITSTHYGPHHGAQSNVLYGDGMAEIAGSMDYPDPGAATHFTGASCTSCHMGEYGSGTGGHTFEPTLNACTNCHAGATSFDINGVRTSVESDLLTLRGLLEDQGVIEEAFDELYEIDQETGDIVLVLVSDGYHPVKGTYSMEQAQAFFNWTGLLEDRSLGVHNPAYVKALVANSIEAITPPEPSK